MARTSKIFISLFKPCLTEDEFVFYTKPQSFQNIHLSISYILKNEFSWHLIHNMIIS
jgi:hypothetical protein